MSDRGWQARIKDMLEAMGNLQAFVQGMTFEDFAADLKTVRAAAFEITTLGEAARYVPRQVRSRHPEVPWDKMQAIRNIVVHEYFRVDVAILWQTITRDLPPLIPVLQAILKEPGV